MKKMSSRGPERISSRLGLLVALLIPLATGCDISEESVIGVSVDASRPLVRLPITGAGVGIKPCVWSGAEASHLRLQPTVGPVRHLFIADVRGDREPEVVVVGKTGISIAKPHAETTSAPIRLEDRIVHALMSDVNSDGKADVLIGAKDDIPTLLAYDGRRHKVFDYVASRPAEAFSAALPVGVHDGDVFVILREEWTRSARGLTRVNGRTGEQRWFFRIPTGVLYAVPAASGDGLVISNQTQTNGEYKKFGIHAEERYGYDAVVQLLVVNEKGDVTVDCVAETVHGTLDGTAWIVPLSGDRYLLYHAPEPTADAPATGLYIVDAAMCAGEGQPRGDRAGNTQANTLPIPGLEHINQTVVYVTEAGRARSATAGGPEGSGSKAKVAGYLLVHAGDGVPSRLVLFGVNFEGRLQHIAETQVPGSHVLIGPAIYTDGGTSSVRFIVASEHQVAAYDQDLRMTDRLAGIVHPTAIGLATTEDRWMLAVAGEALLVFTGEVE